MEKSRSSSRIWDKKARVQNPLNIDLDQGGPADNSLATPSDTILEDKGTSHIARDVKYLGEGYFYRENIYSRTIVVSIHGACRDNGTPQATASYGVYFGNGSDHNEHGLLPKNERQTSQSAPLFSAQRAIEIIEDDFVQGEFKNLVIKTHLAYLAESMSRDIWRWEKNDYENSEGLEVSNRFLFERLHDMIEEAKKERGLCVRFWLVGAEHNQDPIVLAHRALNKGAKAKAMVQIDGPLVRAVKYFMYTAPTEIGAQELCRRVGIVLRRGYPGSFTGVMAPIRRLVITGEDRPRNFARLFGPDWEEAVMYDWGEIRFDILTKPATGAPGDDGVGFMMDVGTPFYRPRLPTVEERQRIDRYNKLLDKKVTVDLKDLMSLASIRKFEQRLAYMQES